MNKLILRTSLATLLVASFGIAQAAQGPTASLAAQTIVSSDRVIPGQDMATHKTARMDRAQAVKSDRTEWAGRQMGSMSVERTGPNGMGSAASGKTP